jgi:hypothetical protein
MRVKRAYTSARYAHMRKGAEAGTVGQPNNDKARARLTATRAAGQGGPKPQEHCEDAGDQAAFPISKPAMHS